MLRIESVLFSLSAVAAEQLLARVEGYHRSQRIGDFIRASGTWMSSTVLEQVSANGISGECDKRRAVHTDNVLLDTSPSPKDYQGAEE